MKDLHRGISDFKTVYQSITNIVKDEKGDVVTDCYSIVARWRNYFSQLFIIHGVSNVMQTEIHTGRTTSVRVPCLSV